MTKRQGSAPGDKRIHKLSNKRGYFADKVVTSEGIVNSNIPEYMIQIDVSLRTLRAFSLLLYCMFHSAESARNESNTLRFMTNTLHQLLMICQNPRRYVKILRTSTILSCFTISSSVVLKLYISSVLDKTTSQPETSSWQRKCVTCWR